MEQPVAKTPRPSMLTADEVAERLKRDTLDKAV